MKRWSLRHQLVAGGAAVAAITLFVGTLGWVGISRVIADLNFVTRGPLASLDKVKDLSLEKSKIKCANRSLLIKDIDAKRVGVFNAEAERAWKRFDEALAAYRSLPSSPEAKAMFQDRVLPSLGAWQLHAREYLAKSRRYRAGGTEQDYEALKAFLFNVVNVEFAQVDLTVDELLALQAQEAEAAQALAARRSAWLKGMIVAGLILGTCLALALALIQAASVTRPVERLCRVMESIIERGDLTQRIDTDRRDEIGDLSRYFSRLVDKVREIPTSLATSVQQLNAAIEELAERARQQDEMQGRQAGALQETQVTVEELRRMSEIAAERAREILALSTQAGEFSRQGELSVAESMSRFNELGALVGEIMNQMGALNDATRSIGDIVDSVKDLADQSNILALNASIEATRAGEMGKGFALVAREVRALADGSLQATKKAREKMDLVSRAIEQAVHNTKNSLPRMETGLLEAQRSGDTLKSLAGISQKNAIMVGQIASAVDQQNAGISQIAGAVTDQNKMMGRSVDSLKAIQQSLALLKSAFATVNGVVLQYKV